MKSHIQQYPPEWAEPITGLSANQIKEVSRMYATTKSAAIDPGNGFEHAPAASDAIRAVAILIAITGHLDRPGGNISSLGSTMPKPKPVVIKDRYKNVWVYD